MIRFLTDENFKSSILAGARRRVPELNIVRVQDCGFRTLRDQLILEFAAAENRIVLTHDVATMRPLANARLAAGKTMTGLFEISQDLPIGRAIDEIVMIAYLQRRR